MLASPAQGRKGDGHTSAPWIRHCRQHTETDQESSDSVRYFLEMFDGNQKPAH